MASKIKLIVDGGNMKPGPAVAQQLGPMGINLGKVIEDVNTATSSFSGIKVPVELTVNRKTKQYEIQVFSPPTAELIKKSLNIDKGSAESLKSKVGNISIESLIGIAKTKMPDLLAKDMKSALKLMVGTCVALGILIDNKEAKDIELEIVNGIYDTEIKEEKSEASPEKLKKLALYLKKVQVAQDKLKKEEEAKEAEVEAKKAAAAEAPAEGEDSAEGADGEASAEETTPADGKEAPKEEKK